MPKKHVSLDHDDELKKILDVFLFDLKNRQAFFMGLTVDNAEAKFFINNIITDIDRIIQSTEKYLKAYQHFDSLDLLAQEEMRTVIHVTPKISLLAIDKRALELFDLFGIRKSPYFESMELDKSDKGLAYARYIKSQLLAIGNPYKPRFSQSHVSTQFSDTPNTFTSSAGIVGRDIRAVAEEVARSPLQRESLNVGVFYYKGAWIAINNRSLTTASISGIEPRLEIVFPDKEVTLYYEQKIAAHGPDDGYNIRFESPSLSAARRVRQAPDVKVPPEWVSLEFALIHPLMESEEAGPLTSPDADTRARVDSRSTVRSSAFSFGGSGGLGFFDREASAESPESATASSLAKSLSTSTLGKP